MLKSIIRQQQSGYPFWNDKLNLIHAYFPLAYAHASSVPKRPIVVTWLPIYKLQFPSWHAADRSVEAISHTSVHISCVKTFKVRVERYKTLRKNNRELIWMNARTGSVSPAVAVKERFLTAGSHTTLCKNDADDPHRY